MPDRAQIETWVEEALANDDKVYQLVEVCRTVAELAETDAKEEVERLKVLLQCKGCESQAALGGGPSQYCFACWDVLQKDGEGDRRQIHGLQEKVTALEFQIREKDEQWKRENCEKIKAEMERDTANRLNRATEEQRDHLINGIREALTILGQQPSTPELCSVAKAIQDGVNRMHAVTEKPVGETCARWTGSDSGDFRCELEKNHDGACAKKRKCRSSFGTLGNGIPCDLPEGHEMPHKAASPSNDPDVEWNS